MLKKIAIIGLMMMNSALLYANHHRIAVVGTGYVGLVLGAGLADFGHYVTCVDIDERKVAMLNRGELPIYEPGLEDVVRRNTQSAVRYGPRLRFTSDIANAIREASVVFIAVGTPTGDDGHADLRAVKAVAQACARNLNGYKVIVTKSTVPIGTGKLIRSILAESQSDDFSIVSNPEFLREGSAVKDFFEPDRVVIGVDSERAASIMREIYRPLHQAGVPFLVTDVVTAETIKYAANAFLAVKVTYINELANLCDVTGANIKDVAAGMALDSRISPKFLNPGPGFGGSCFPKDSLELALFARDNGVHLDVVDASLTANNRQAVVMVDKLQRLLNESVQGKTVAILGLAFKANTDDVRESPALRIIGELKRRGATIKAYDPIATKTMAVLEPTLEYCSDVYEAVAGADAAIVVTEWHEFVQMNLEEVKNRMRVPVILDTRNILDRKALCVLGFSADNVGNA